LFAHHVHAFRNSPGNLVIFAATSRLIAKFLIFVKAQSRRLSILSHLLLMFSFAIPQLNGPPFGGLLFVFRSVQEFNSSGSLAILPSHWPFWKFF
jgi:hypothetical protein